MDRATWQSVPTGSDASLRGLHAVSDDLVWATGNGGTVLRTIDGGRSWERFQLDPSYDIRDVHALDERNAFVLVVTEPASVFRTRDGGESWEELYRYPHPDAFFDSFTFLDENRAILFGDPVDGQFLILVTRDGGRTWAEAQSAPEAHAGEGGFAASGTCIVSDGEQAWIGTGGLATRILRSTDAGLTWTASPGGVVSGEPTTGIYSVAFRDARHGVAVGGDYTKPEVASGNAVFTEDGGRTWHPVPDGSRPRGQRASAVWIPGRKETVVTVGRTGSEFSADGGRTWQPLGDEGFYALSAAPDGGVWAVGAEGRAARLVFGD